MVIKLSRKLTTKDFIERSKQIHGCKYDYSLSEYVNKDTKLIIICPAHGEFRQTPNNHWKGKGCPKCSGNAKSNTSDFVSKAKSIHGDKYDYSKSEYKNMNTSIKIICKEHGEFMQSPYKHLSGRGCPKCGITKMKNTNLNKYGSEYAIKSQIVRDKMKNTCLEKYGVENPGGLDFVQDKIKKTNMDKFGVPYAVSSDIIRKKSQETLMRNHGVAYPFESNSIKEKAKKTMIERYGITVPIHNPEIRERTIKTNKNKYGKEFPLLDKNIRDMCTKTLKRNFGVANPMHSEEIKEKVFKRKCENNSFNKSRPEERLYELLVDKFGIDGVLRQYKSELYPFACDFYIKSIDTYIELNANWTHNNHFFNKTNQEDLDKIKDWKMKSKEHPFYNKAIETWTMRDIEKRNCALRNHLNYVVFWDNNLSDAIEWLNSQ